LSKATRVAAQVKDQTLQVALLVHVLDGLGEILAGAILEPADADIAVAGLDHLRAHALDVDLLARQREGQRCFGFLADDGQQDLRAGLAAHHFDRLRQRHAARRGVIDLDDQVAGLDARAKRRRILDRRDDADHAVFDAHFDAEAAELALRVDLQFLESVGIEEIGVRVEPVHHAVDRFLDELFIRDLLDVIALDLAEDRREELQVFVGDRQFGLALGDRRKVKRKQDSKNGAQAD
jgi:hypothetical protein